MATTLPLPPSNVPVFDASGQMNLQWANYYLALQNYLDALTVPPIDARYVVAASDPTLTNEVNLGALASGYLKQTTTLGVATPSTTTTIPFSDVTGTVPATQGGTGQTNYAVGDLLYAATTSTLSKLPDVATGNALISGGVSTAPAWGKVGLTTHVTGTLPIANGGTNSSAALSGSSVMVSDGTSIVQGPAGTTTTVLHGNATGTPTYSAVSLTADVTGTLPATNGGTGAASYAVGDLLYASSTTALAKLPDVATGNALISGGVGVAPSYGKVGLTTHVSGTLPVANGGTNSSTALSGSSIMVSDGTSIVQGPAGTTTTVLHGNASGTPTYGAVSLTADVTGTLPVANGGTGVTSLATTAWTPEFRGSGGQSGQVYSSQAGQWWQFGPYVVAQFFLVLSTLGTITGSLQINLPTTAANVSGGWVCGLDRFANLNTTWIRLYGQIAASGSVATVRGLSAAATSATTALTSADLTATSEIRGTLIYFA